MGVPDSSTTTQRNRSPKPPPCPACQGHAWWNGWRQIFPRLAEGRVEMFLPRGRCKAGCVDFVVRPEGIYPHRQYQPDVVAGAVAAVVIGGTTPAKAAATVEASTTSVRRWTCWVAKLADVVAVLALASQLWPAGVAGAGLGATAPSTSSRAVAARVLHALETLGEALLQNGAKLISKSGLGRLLEWQYRTHGDVIHLVAEPRSFSPGMALDGQGGHP